MTTRRDFFAGAAPAPAALLTGGSFVGAQQQPRVMQMHDSSLVKDSANLFAMDQEAAKPVRLPPKAGAKPLFTALERDALERQIHCQCSCTLDVFTCRTTDFSCQVSPAMHRDVVALVEGGYSAQEILDAFVGVYGERALMAPSHSGFNLVGWFTPAIAVIVAGGFLSVFLRRLGRMSSARAASQSKQPTKMQVDATPDELARLDAVVKGDDRA